MVFQFEGKRAERIIMPFRDLKDKQVVELNNGGDISSEEIEESYQTYIEPEKIDNHDRSLEHINNRFIQKIAEIKRLQESITVDRENLKVLAVRQFDEGYVIDVNNMRFSNEDTSTDFFAESIGWDHVDSVVVSKKGAKQNLVDIS